MIAGYNPPTPLVSGLINWGRGLSTTRCSSTREPQAARTRRSRISSHLNRLPQREVCGKTRTTPHSQRPFSSVSPKDFQTPVLPSTIGSRGDFQPLLALEVQLRQLGADVRLCAPPDFRELADGHGLPFVPT